MQKKRKEPEIHVLEAKTSSCDECQGTLLKINYYGREKNVLYMILSQFSIERNKTTFSSVIFH